MWKFFTLKKVGIVLLMLAGIVIAARVYALPWVVKQLVEAGLGDLGIESINQLSVEYSLRDLWDGRVDRLVVTGGRFEIRNVDGRIQVGKIKASEEQTAKPQAAVTIPVRSLEVKKAKLVIASEEDSIEVVVNGTLVVSGSVLEIKLDADDGGAQINGQWDTAANDAVVHATVDTAAANKALDAADLLAAAEGIDKLSVHKGVIHIDGNLGKNGSSLTVRLDGLDVEEAGNELVIEDANAAIELTNLSPISTAADQTISVARVKVGETELTDGSVTFRIENNAAVIGETRWRWLGGAIAAHDVHIAAGEPVRVMIEAHELSLKDLLATFAEGKVQGDGKLTGQVPLVISNGGVTFGEGAIGALGSGELKIVDASLTEPIAAAAQQGVGEASQEQVKRNIMEALKNFRFERLSAKFQQEQQGLVAYVRISGHGQTGAKQALDYDLRITGLNELIQSVLKIRARMQQLGT